MIRPTILTPEWVKRKKRMAEELMRRREYSKMRGYKCSKCGKPLIEGLEFQFPPRLSYWYCSTCQLVFKETDKGVVVFHGEVEGNEKLCIQEEEIRGYVQDGHGRKIYPDTF